MTNDQKQQPKITHYQTIYAIGKERKSYSTKKLTDYHKAIHKFKTITWAVTYAHLDIPPIMGICTANIIAQTDKKVLKANKPFPNN